MKKIVLIILIGCLCNNAFAQLEKLSKAKPLKKQTPAEIINKLQMQQKSGLVAIPKTNGSAAMPLLNTLTTKRLVGQTTDGNELYVIEPYNMPCISPGKSFKSNMPIAGAKKPLPAKTEEK